MVNVLTESPFVSTEGLFVFTAQCLQCLYTLITSFMKELHGFQTSQLLNLLAKETINYYKLVGYGASVEECTQCNNGIKQIQMELESRRIKEEKNILQRENISAPVEYSY
jgi:hypothetical protein